MNVGFKTLGMLLGLLTEERSVERAVLFGSRATGTNKTNSDIDIAIFFRHDLENPVALLEILRENITESTLIVNVDLVAVGEDTDLLLKEEIERTGITIFERRIISNAQTLFQRMLGDFEVLLKELEEVLNSDIGQFDSGLETRLKIWRQATLSLTAQCFERAWKTIRRYAIDEGYDRAIQGSKDAIRAGNALGLVEDPELWFEAIVKRNNLIHEYELTIANDTLKFVLDVQLGLFQGLFEQFKKKAESKD